MFEVRSQSTCESAQRQWMLSRPRCLELLLHFFMSLIVCNWTQRTVALGNVFVCFTESISDWLFHSVRKSFTLLTVNEVFCWVFFVELLVQVLFSSKKGSSFVLNNILNDRLVFIWSVCLREDVEFLSLLLHLPGGWLVYRFVLKSATESLSFKAYLLF